MAESHVLCPEDGFRYTPLMQNLCLLAGLNDVYGKAPELLLTFLGVCVSDSTVQRLCQEYGKRLEINLIKEVEASQKTPEPAQKEEPESAQKEAVEKEGVPFDLIAVDGSYVPTRGEEGVAWKEVKLARFDVSDGSRPSRYLAYLGGHEEFLRRLGAVSKNKKNLVFLGDGAPWFWNWVEKTHPDSIQILDFYHAKSHLWKFAQAYWRKTPLQADLWIAEQDRLLKADGVEAVLSGLKKINPKGRILKQIHGNLIDYIEKNKKRMLYQTLSARGLPIGSGAIESAHREVVQKRMKRAGQKWSLKGGQAMLMLRAKYCGKQWNEVIELIKKGA